MFRTPSRWVIGFVLTGTLTQVPVLLHAQAPAAGQAATAAPSGNGQKNWKDRDEFDLYTSIGSDTNPQSQLDKLNQWKTKYPQSDFADVRRALYLATYVKLNQPQNALNAAKEILAADPSEFQALYYTMFLTPQIPVVTNQPATPEQLDAASKAANALLNGALDTQFAAAKKPATVTDDQWKQARTSVEAEAHKDLGWVAMQQKQYEPAETEFQKSLAMNPNDGNVDYWLGSVIVAEKNQAKQDTAYFYFARAAAYDGPGALTPQGRDQVMSYIKNAYTKYHGGTDGFDQLLATAKANPTPPAGFKLVSAMDIEKNKIAQEEKLKQDNPSLALWLNLKQQLTGADGANYFNANMKDAAGIPALTGKVVSMEPATRPKTVVIAIENGTTPDATLTFETALPGKVDPGTTLTFTGVPVSYTPNPFMVTFKVERKDLKGWTGTGPAAAPVRRRPAAHR